MSRALLFPIPDWTAASVACVMLSSMKPGKSLSRDQTLSKGKFRLRVLAELDAFVHRSDDVCPARELVRDELPEIQQRLRV